MKLYRAKIPVIAQDTIETLARQGDIDVDPSNREEAAQDLVAILEEFLRRDNDFRNQIKDHMAQRRIPYDQYGKTRNQLAEELDHPQGDDIERFLCRQFVENMLISPHVEEVYADDQSLYKTVMEILRRHDVDEREIREEAQGRIKNVVEGTVEYEIALRDAMRDIKKRRGLL